MKTGVKMNVKKTKFMAISRNGCLEPSVVVAGRNLQRVRKYKYFTKDWNSGTEAKTPIAVVGSAFYTMRKVSCCRRLKIPLRILLLQCYVWPMLLCDERSGQ